MFSAMTLSEIRYTFNIQGVTQIITAKVYRLEGVNKAETERIAQELLVDKINQTYTLNQAITKDADQKLKWHISLEL